MRIKLISLPLLLLFGMPVFSQARLVISSAYVVIDNAALVVVDNPATNAIVNTGTGGISTESEFDQVLWRVGAATGSYVLPFVSQSTLTQIPMTMNITSAGNAAGVFRFSTYPGPIWDNNTYRPSDVTHMFDYNTNTINNSAHVVDRFWILDNTTYTSKPSAALSFTYRDVEWTAAGNTITEANLGAQRFHPGPNLWGDYLPQGSTNTATNLTSGVPAPASDFYRSWTLSETTNPLSVDLVYFQASCENGFPTLYWQTEDEENTDHFEIEWSEANAASFSVIGYVPTAGNGPQHYEYSSQTRYAGTFRLTEVDKNGSRNVLSAVSAMCDGPDETIFSYNASDESLLLQFNSAFNEQSDFTFYDLNGKLLLTTKIEAKKGYNVISIPASGLSSGIYLLSLENSGKTTNQKLLIAK